MATYHLDILTPVHIGSGQSLSPLEYLLVPHFIPFDLGRLLESDPSKAEQLAIALSRLASSQLTSTSLHNLITPEVASDQRCWQYQATISQSTRSLLEDQIKRGQGEVKTAIKSPTFQVYIPGTSLKGALRTAFEYFLLRQRLSQDVDLLEYMIRDNRFKNQIDQQLTKVLFRRAKDQATHDLFRTLQVSDSSLCRPAEALEIISEQVLSVSINKTGRGRVDRGNDETKRWVTFLEVIRPGTRLQGKIEFTENLLSQNRIIEQLGWRNEREYLNLEHLCRFVNTFAQDIFSRESLYFQQVRGFDVSAIKSFYTELGQRLQNPQPGECYLSLGHGSGWHKMTVGLLLEKHLPARFDQLVRTGKARQRQDFQYPKTRKLVMQNGNPHSPLGWVRLVFGDYFPMNRVASPASTPRQASSHPIPRQKTGEQDKPASGPSQGKSRPTLEDLRRLQERFRQ